MKNNIILKVLVVFIVLFTFQNCKSNNSKEDTINYEHTNALVNESSPYLLQHAHNPVDWQPWNPEVLKRAAKENKLIIVSIGYSACHWCHVMEEESFADEAVAAFMNENFISIKVDREERPDIDKIYNDAVQLITGNSGWPLNCILLPNGKPIFGGTYFTKTQWTKTLKEVLNLYKANPEKVITYAEKLTEGIKNNDLIALNNAETVFTISTLKKYIKQWNTHLDFNYGGQQTDNKFPLPNNLAFQLRHSYQNDDEALKTYVHTTLTKMAYGGIYDQVGGGFSRYATDKKWHIPHFEKMLYDNAQLVSLYSNAYLASKNKLYKHIVEETLAFIKRELTGKDGEFYSSLDADSVTKNKDFKEGAFYSWTKEELQVIITEDYKLFSAYYNINSYGKWKKDNYILIRNKTNTAFAKKHSISITELETKIALWKKALFEAREKREKPRLDDKVLTSWNALMLKGYTDAYRVFKKPKYLEAAKKNAAFIIKNQLKTDGRLYHNYKDGSSSINGHLDDYATVIDAFITLYQVTFNEKWLQHAKALLEYTQLHFLDKTTKMYYFASDLDTNLIVRNIEITDNVMPSSNSIMAHNLFKIGHYFSNSDDLEHSKQMLNNVFLKIDDAPSAYSNWLALMSNHSNPYYEIAISGSEALKKATALNSYYLPHIMIAGAFNKSNLPIMKNRFNAQNTLVYVCVNGTCKFPLTEIKDVLRLIDKK